MQTDLQRDLNDDGLDALVAKLNNRYRILAEAAEAAHAEYLIMQHLSRTRPEHLAPPHRQWRSLQLQRQSFAAQLEPWDG
jgi:hypothetical protein